MRAWRLDEHTAYLGGDDAIVSPFARRFRVDAVLPFSERRLRAALQGNGIVTEVRGIGLMIGVDFVDADAAAEVEVEAFKRGLLVLTCGDRGVRMSPPLVVNAEEIKTAVRIFAEAAAAVAARR